MPCGSHSHAAVPADHGPTPPRPRALRLEALEDRCLLSAGALDPTFGNGAGYVTTFLGASGIADSAGQVLIQPSGAIIAVGSTTTTVKGDSSPVPAFGIAAYNPNGSLDTAFGSRRATTELFAGNAGADFASAALEPMGTTGDYDILLAGKVNGQGGLAVMRLNANGTLDTTFGTNGQVVTQIETSAPTDVTEGPTSIAVTSSGQILVVGYDGYGTVVMAEYNPNGTLDTSFGSGGTTIFRTGSDIDLIHSVAPQSNGDVVLAGQQEVPSTSGTPQYEGLLLRYKANSALDTTFGNGGIVTTQISGEDTGFRGVAIDPSTGQIVVSGDVETNQGNGNVDVQWAAARYNSNGSLDTTFGNGTGSVILPQAQALPQQAPRSLWHFSRTAR